VLANPPWSTTVVAKVALVDTCTRYDVAPVEALQFNVGFVATPVAVLVGETRVGADGIALVVKLHTLDHALVPATFVAFTRQ
jgi:hypothetical protein